MANNIKLVDAFLESKKEEIENLRKTKGFQWSTVAKSFKAHHGYVVSGEYLRGRFRKISQKNPISNFPFQYSANLKDGKTEITTVVSEEIRSLDDLVRVCKIDTNVWNIDKYVANTWGNPNNQQWQIKAFLSKKVKQGKSIEQQFTEFIDNYNLNILNPPVKKKVEPNTIQDAMYLISLADLHIGKGQKPNYLEKILSSIEYSLLSVKDAGVKKVVILNLGDLIHTDSSKGQTTAGTQLEFEETYEDSFTKALDFLTKLVDTCLEYTFDVTFINCRGNHSFDTEYALGEALKKIYRKTKEVEILNPKENRVYYYWNNNAFLLTHGDKGLERLPLTFATEGSEYFSKAENRHILLGHLHHSRSKQFVSDRGEYQGVEIRVLGSPTATDRWHSQEAYVNNKQCLITMLFTPEHGKFAEYSFKI